MALFTVLTPADIISVYIGAGSHESHYEQWAKVPWWYTIYGYFRITVPVASCVSWKRRDASRDESDLGIRHHTIPQSTNGPGLALALAAPALTALTSPSSAVYHCMQNMVEK